MLEASKVLHSHNCNEHEAYCLKFMAALEFNSGDYSQAKKYILESISLVKDNQYFSLVKDL